MFGTDVQVLDSQILDGESDGIDLNGSSIPPTVERCMIERNKAFAIDNLALDAVSGFSGNSADSNGGDYMRLTVATLAGDTTVTADNCLEGAIVMYTPIVVPVGVTLTLGPGVVFKSLTDYPTNREIVVNGTLLVEGTAPLNSLSLYSLPLGNHMFAFRVLTNYKKLQNL